MTVVARPNLDKLVAAKLGVFTADCLATDAIGDIVYRNSATSVTKANITSFSTMPAVGVIISKTGAFSCKVQSLGPVAVYTGLSAGRLYCVGTNSRPTLLTPVPGPSQTLFVQNIGTAVDSTTLLITINNQLTLVRG